MQAGRRRERVRFERQAEDSDGRGNPLGDWKTLFPPVSAEIKPVRGNETVEAMRLQGRQVVEIGVPSSRTTREVKTSDRVVNDRSGTTYNIIAIENRDMRNIDLTITAEAGRAA